MNESTNRRMHESTPSRMARSYRDLEVYQKAYTLALEVHTLSLTFPKHEQYALADQLRRATKSICANLAEGFDRQQFSKPEFRRFLMMASSSCPESRVWLQFALDLGYIDAAAQMRLDDILDHVHRMIHRLVPHLD